MPDTEEETTVPGEFTDHIGASIWMVDDDTELLRAIEKRIKASGWNFSCFPDGESLEQALEATTPDLVILDRLLPGKSGIDTLQGLRNSGYRFPVIMLSALGSASRRIEGLGSGAIDYMGKPFLWRELQFRIERILDLREAERECKRLQQNALYIDGVIRFSPMHQEITSPEGNITKLTKGETSTLLTLCMKPRTYISREELLKSSESKVDASRSRSIDMRISKLRKVLSSCIGGHKIHIQSARGSGYRINASITEERAP